MNSVDVAPNTKLIKLSRGEDVLATLSTYFATAGIQNASFTGIGAVNELRCGYYDLEKREYFFKDYEGMYEVVSLSGNVILKDAKPFIHLHAVFTDEQNHAFGGHVDAMRVGVTLEIVLTVFSTSLSRAYDEETGLFLIDSSN